MFLLLLALCPAGWYSADGGIAPCKKCAISQYQPSTGHTSCLACPSGQTTLAAGARSGNDCVGKFYLMGQTMHDLPGGHWTW